MTIKFYSCHSLNVPPFMWVIHIHIKSSPQHLASAQCDHHPITHRPASLYTCKLPQKALVLKHETLKKNLRPQLEITSYKKVFGGI